MLKKRNLLLIIVILIITMGFSLFALKGQITKETSESKPTPTITKETLSKIRETFPVVEHSKASSLEKENPKSKKYNEALRVLSLDKDIPKNLESFSAHHWEKGLTALPIEKSDVVILGKVIDAKAHLSPDKSTVYSEFKIEIEEVFKNNSHLGF
ncbi:MAG TPA: hypothetical protein VK892_17980, partial [Pyrinomonadaceae bacterium]|nr:hypothetical protein [Pyrinomonadaceae bacterium]